MKIRIQTGPTYNKVRRLVQDLKLNTICAEGHCPNVYECWSQGTATFMVLGDICTRRCGFCAVKTGMPSSAPDPLEPRRLAQGVKALGLKHIVITSVDRDDLPDGGAAHYAACIRAIHGRMPQTAVEALTPDFGGREELVAQVLDAGLATFAQNVETVERLTHPVRDPRAGYWRTINLLKFAKQHAPQTVIKTSLMLGLGETDDEIERTLDDLRAANVDVVTMGQYMRPTRNHLPVERFVTPEQFNQYREIGLAKGFLEVVAGPLVRSSYRAEQVLEHNNVGLERAGLDPVIVEGIREASSMRC